MEVLIQLGHQGPGHHVMTHTIYSSISIYAPLLVELSKEAQRTHGCYNCWNIGNHANNNMFRCATPPSVS